MYLVRLALGKLTGYDNILVLIIGIKNKWCVAQYTSQSTLGKLDGIFQSFSVKIYEQLTACSVVRTML